jgi:hypothetical protein
MPYVDGFLESLPDQDRQALGKFLKDHDSRPLPNLEAPMPNLTEPSSLNLQKSH